MNKVTKQLILTNNSIYTFFLHTIFKKYLPETGNKNSGELIVGLLCTGADWEAGCLWQFLLQYVLAFMLKPSCFRTKLSEITADLTLCHYGPWNGLVPFGRTVTSLLIICGQSKKMIEFTFSIHLIKAPNLSFCVKWLSVEFPGHIMQPDLNHI